ncbi:hypothetical protein HN51_042789 [Arachis hypogaea]
MNRFQSINVVWRLADSVTSGMAAIFLHRNYDESFNANVDWKIMCLFGSTFHHLNLRLFFSNDEFRCLGHSPLFLINFELL